MVRLTKRENQIAEFVAWGASVKEIAFRLSLSIRTIENHIRNIHQKTGIQSPNALSAWWFCRTYGIDQSLSPLKRIIAMIFIALIISTEFTDATVIRTFRTRTEVRSGRREGDSDVLNDLYNF